VVSKDEFAEFIEEETKRDAELLAMFYEQEILRKEYLNPNLDDHLTIKQRWQKFKEEQILEQQSKDFLSRIQFVSSEPTEKIVSITTKESGTDQSLTKETKNEPTEAQLTKERKLAEKKKMLDKITEEQIKVRKIIKCSS
jgi:hypothetical protein